MRRIVERGRARAPFFTAPKPTPKKIRDPITRRIIERIVGRLNKRILRPRQIINLIANTGMEWIRVHNVEELAHLNGKNNYLSICLAEERRLAPIIQQGTPSPELKQKWDHAQHVLGLFRDPDIIYIAPFSRKSKTGIVMLIGPKASPKKVYQAIARRMLESDDEYFDRLAKGPGMLDMFPQAYRREQAAQKEPSRFKILFHALDPKTKKFRPIYGPKNEYPEYGSP